MKPITGMTTDHYGLPLMAGAWLGCLITAVDLPGAKDAFMAETGHDLSDVLGAKGLDRLIDESTGRTREVVVAWADWVTKNLWGEEERN